MMISKDDINRLAALHDDLDFLKKDFEVKSKVIKSELKDGATQEEGADVVLRLVSCKGKISMKKVILKYAPELLARLPEIEKDPEVMGDPYDSLYFDRPKEVSEQAQAIAAVPAVPQAPAPVAVPAVAESKPQAQEVQPQEGQARRIWPE